MAFGEVYDVTSSAERQQHEHVEAGVKEDVRQARDDADDAGENEVKGFLVDADAIAEVDRALEMAADEGEDSTKEIVQRSPPLYHAINI